MPPRGGHGHGGGRHGGHGHHGGHHHHGHHGRRPGGWSGGWGPGWYGPGVWYGDTYPGYSELIVTPQCPGTLDPVLATDGRVYNNDCEARAAGYAVVRRVAPGALRDYVATGDIPGVSNVMLLAGIGVAAYLLFFRKSPRERTASHVRTAIARRR